MRLLLAVDSVETTEMLMNAVTSRPWPHGTKARVLSVVEERRWPADLILIRAHNRTDFRSWMLGSVAKSVVREAPCSVEVVRAVKEDLSVLGNGHMKILLATDGSDQAVAAARAVAECPWPEGTEVKVLSMVGPVLYSIEEIGLFDGGGTDRAHRAIGNAAQILQGAGIKTSGEVIAGKPDRQITHEAKAWGADLIVVGTRDPSWLRRFISGSVSDTVASRAHCSVKIVRLDARRHPSQGIGPLRGNPLQGRGGAANQGTGHGL